MRGKANEKLARDGNTRCEASRASIAMSEIPTEDLVAALQDTCAGYRAITQPLGLRQRSALTLWNVRSGDKDGYADPIRMTRNTLKAQVRRFTAGGPGSRRVRKLMIAGWRKVLRDGCFHAPSSRIGVSFGSRGLAATADPREAKITSRTECILRKAVKFRCRLAGGAQEPPCC